jgi:HSP20 family protein
MFGSLTNLEGRLFDEFKRVEQELDQMFGRWTWPTGIRTLAGGSFPPINVASTLEQMDVYLFAAGLDPQGLDISIQQNLLTVAGTRKAEREEDAEYYRQERFDGDFRRVITLPDDVDPERVEAAYKDGVLHIRVQRHEATKPRQIKVK